jgi:hypothetical protein
MARTVAGQILRLSTEELHRKAAQALADGNFPLALFLGNELDHREDWEHDYGERQDWHERDRQVFIEDRTACYLSPGPG